MTDNFDFDKLKKIFLDICPDFMNEPNYENATISRRFAEQVIFEYSKQAKEAKFKGKDETWKVVLKSKSAEGKDPLIYRVIISTYFTKDAPKQQPFLLHEHLQLTFKQASLLAVDKYCQLVPHLLERNALVLPPLAGAVFSKHDLPKLAEELKEPLPQVVMNVISSCQTDGYYLEHSRCYIALAAIINTVADTQMRISIVKKALKSYKQHGKDFDMVKFKICSKFIKPNSKKSQRSIHSEVDQMNDLVSEIIAFKLDPEKNKPASTNNQSQSNKKHLKCAASFTGPLKNKNAKK